MFCYIAKNTNANTITHFVPKKAKKIQACIADLQERLPGAQVKLAEVAIVCVIGTNMGLPGFLSRAARALAEAEINVLGLDQAMRQVNMQFIVRLKDFAPAQLALHREFVENEG